MKTSFPLASLTLLVTCFAVLLACTDIDRWREQYTWLSQNWPWRMVAIFGGAAIFGAVVGIGFMFASKTRWRTRILAPVAAILAAEIGTLILIAPGPLWRTIFAVMVLISTAILFRLDAE